MIKRVEHRAYSQERLGALLERHPSDVYVMSVIADELAWHVEVVSSFGCPDFPQSAPVIVVLFFLIKK